MRTFLILLTWFFIGSTSGVEIPEENGILVLTKDNFEEALKAHEFILVEFYAPWCTHCKGFAVQYEKAAKKLADEDSEIKLAKVDATIEDELADRFNIKGYPMLRLFRRGVVTDYRGGREPDDIVAWLKKKSGPPAVELKSEEEFEKFTMENGAVVVGFFSDLSTKDAEIFQEAAFIVNDYPFAIVTSDDLCEKYEVKCGNVVLFKQYDEKRNTFEGELTVENLKKFAIKNGIPLITQFSAETASKIFASDIKTQLMILISKKSGDFEKLIEPLKEVAKKFRDEILFVGIDADDEQNQAILKHFMVDPKQVPTLRISKVKDNEMLKFKPETNELTPESTENFIQSFLDGKIEAFYLSQELPEDWDKNPVKILVGSNFDEVTLDTTKNVFVKVYAPWCKHCKDLAPVIDRLGEIFKDSDSVVIAKIDASLNQLKNVKIEKYPTLLLFRMEDNSMVFYEGDRSLEGLVKFLGGKLDDEKEEEAEVEKEEVTKDEL